MYAIAIRRRSPIGLLLVIFDFVICVHRVSRRETQNKQAGDHYDYNILSSLRAHDLFRPNVRVRTCGFVC